MSSLEPSPIQADVSRTRPTTIVQQLSVHRHEFLLVRPGLALRSSTEQSVFDRCVICHLGPYARHSARAVADTEPDEEMSVFVHP